jgi:PAS domain S-box-containing protein
MGAGLQLMAKRKDGSEFPVEISLSPVETKDGTLITAVVRDNTERRRSEDAIRAQAELLDLAQDAIILLNVEGSIQYWNSGAESTYGWTPEEALGQPIHDLLNTTFPTSRDEVYAQLFAAGAWEGELEHTRQDGRRITVANRMVVRRSPDGSPTAIMHINRDMTERRQIERDRERLLIEAERSEDRERIGMDLHDGIIQSIYAVSLGLEAVADDIAKDPKAAETGLNTAMDQLGDVIRDVRSYIFELRPSRFTPDLAESFNDMIRDFEKSTSMRVESDIDRDLPQLGEEERAMLFHIAREALTNARRHANPKWTKIALQAQPGHVRLEIQDDGRGFDTAEGWSDEHRGLQNMNARAAASSAELTIKSAPGQGTIVIVDLPVEGDGRSSR